MAMTENEALESYNAIRNFLPSSKLVYRSFLNVEIIVCSDSGRHAMNDTIELIYRDDAVYTLYSNCFFRYTKTTKINSSEYIFNWDEATKELYTFHDVYKIIIKFVSNATERD